MQSCTNSAQSGMAPSATIVKPNTKSRGQTFLDFIQVAAYNPGINIHFKEALSPSDLARLTLVSKKTRSTATPWLREICPMTVKLNERSGDFRDGIHRRIQGEGVATKRKRDEDTLESASRVAYKNEAYRATYGDPGHRLVIRHPIDAHDLAGAREYFRRVLTYVKENPVTELDSFYYREGYGYNLKEEDELLAIGRAIGKSLQLRRLTIHEYRDDQFCREIFRNLNLSGINYLSLHHSYNPEHLSFVKCLRLKSLDCRMSQLDFIFDCEPKDVKTKLSNLHEYRCPNVMDAGFDSLIRLIQEGRLRTLVIDYSNGRSLSTEQAWQERSTQLVAALETSKTITQLEIYGLDDPKLIARLSNIPRLQAICHIGHLKSSFYNNCEVLKSGSPLLHPVDLRISNLNCDEPSSIAFLKKAKVKFTRLDFCSRRKLDHIVKFMDALKENPAFDPSKVETLMLGHPNHCAIEDSANTGILGSVANLTVGSVAKTLEWLRKKKVTNFINQLSGLKSLTIGTSRELWNPHHFGELDANLASLTELTVRNRLYTSNEFHVLADKLPSCKNLNRLTIAVYLTRNKYNELPFPGDGLIHVIEKFEGDVLRLEIYPDRRLVTEVNQEKLNVLEQVLKKKSSLRIEVATDYGYFHDIPRSLSETLIKGLSDRRVGFR